MQDVRLLLIASVAIVVTGFMGCFFYYLIVFNFLATQ